MQAPSGIRALESITIQGSVLATQDVKCHKLKFDRSEYEDTVGGSKAPEHFHVFGHVDSIIYRLYTMYMRIIRIETTSGSQSVDITVDGNHNIAPAETNAVCKFKGTFSDDVNGITMENGFKIGTNHTHSITPHANDASKFSVSLSEPATSTGIVSAVETGADFSTLNLCFNRWYYIDMATTNGWTFAYGEVGPTASHI